MSLCTIRLHDVRPQHVVAHLRCYTIDNSPFTTKFPPLRTVRIAQARRYMQHSLRVALASRCTMDLTSTREFKGEGIGAVRTKRARSESGRWSEAEAEWGR